MIADKSEMKFQILILSDDWIFLAFNFKFMSGLPEVF